MQWKGFHLFQKRALPSLRIISYDLPDVPKVVSSDCMSAPIVTENAAVSKSEARSLKELSPQQWRSGIAAWLGWMFDGLDMHLYTLVAAPFVMELVRAASVSDASVKTHSAYIQAGFLIGWALGGGF